jgi:hypothetical protein
VLGNVSTSQEAGQDQHAFGVHGTTELHLTLDIDDGSGAQTHTSGNAAWPRESKPTQLDDGQAVDLPPRRAARGDYDRPAPDLLLEPLSRPPCPMDLRLDRTPHVAGIDGRMPRHPGPVGGFTEQIGEAA